MPNASAPPRGRARTRNWAASACAPAAADADCTADSFQQLGQMIVSGDLGADRPLVPEEIGQRFEVSRTVVRGLLRCLLGEGAGQRPPHACTRVLRQ